ncbi:MAG: protease inhibitor I42 family protein [Nitrolancea sp.]
MFRVRVAFLTTFILILIAGGCTTNGKETKQIGTKDAGKTISLSVGDTIEVALEGNPTTGYNWEAANLDTSILKQVGDVAYTPESSAVGAPGQVVLRFEAVGSGETALQLIYHRSFETGVAPLQTFEVTVQVD